MSEKWVVVEMDPGAHYEGPSVAEVHGFFASEDEATRWARLEYFSDWEVKRVRKAVTEQDVWA